MLCGDQPASPVSVHYLASDESVARQRPTNVMNSKTAHSTICIQWRELISQAALTKKPFPDTNVQDKRSEVSCLCPHIALYNREIRIPAVFKTVGYQFVVTSQHRQTAT
jgi:hypothetical protein